MSALFVHKIKFSSFIFASFSNRFPAGTNVAVVPIFPTPFYFFKKKRQKKKEWNSSSGDTKTSKISQKKNQKEINDDATDLAWPLQSPIFIKKTPLSPSPSLYTMLFGTKKKALQLFFQFPRPLLFLLPPQITLPEKTPSRRRGGCTEQKRDYFFLFLGKKKIKMNFALRGVVVFVLLLLTEVNAQCGQGSGVECALTPDLDLLAPEVGASSVSVNDTVFTFQRRDSATPTYGLATLGGQQRLQFDPLPKNYLDGSQMAVVIYPYVYVFACASSDPLAYNYSNEIYRFNPSLPVGSQYTTLTTNIPKRTNSRVIVVGGSFYVTGNGDLQAIVVDPISLNYEVLIRFDPPTTDYYFASDTVNLFAVGGKSKEAPYDWTTGFYVFSLERLEQDVSVDLQLPKPIEGVMGEMIGPYLFILDWGALPLEVLVWSNFSKSITSFPIPADETLFPNRSLFSTAQRVTENGPIVYIIGGEEGNDNQESLKMCHISTGITYPTYTLSPASPAAGRTTSEETELLVSTVGTAVGMPSYSFRISRTADCFAPLEGTEDQHFVKSINFSLGPSAVGLAYACYSQGGCPDTGETLCSPPTISEGLCTLGCCRVVVPTELCLAPERDSRSAVYYPLSLTPFQILPYISPLESPAPDTEAPKSHTVSIDKTALWIVGLLLGVCAVMVCVGYFLYLKLQPRKNHIQITCSNDAYIPIEKLGSGSYGVVYLMKRRDDGGLFAMKYISCASDDARDEAMQEFAVLRGFQGHPNMVRVVETFMNWTEMSGLPEHDSGNKSSGDVGGSWPREGSDLSSRPLQAEIMQRGSPRYVCIVMQFYKEGDMKKYICSFLDAKRTIPESTILEYVKQICSLLKVMHASTPPVVHRDLKPENVLLQDDCQGVVVTDFGLAKSIANTYCNTQVGSLPYVAPECWERHYGTEVDIWSVGCIAYAAAARRAQAHDTRVMFSDTLRDAAGLQLELQNEMEFAGYSKFFSNLVVSLLEKDRHNRPTAEDIYNTICAHQSPKQACEVPPNSAIERNEDWANEPSEKDYSMNCD